jgi:hypothetical protein
MIGIGKILDNSDGAWSRFLIGTALCRLQMLEEKREVFCLVH